MIFHSCNPRTQDVEALRSEIFQGQPGLHETHLEGREEGEKRDFLKTKDFFLIM